MVLFCIVALGTTIAQRACMDHTVLPANTPRLSFLRMRSPDGATSNWGKRHLIAAYYSSIDTEVMKGWVGLVGWPIADGLPTSVVTHQLQVELRTEKVRRPKTDVLPLSHATTDIGDVIWTVTVINQRTSPILLTSPRITLPANHRGRKPPWRMDTKVSNSKNDLQGHWRSPVMVLPFDRPHRLWFLISLQLQLCVYLAFFRDVTTYFPKLKEVTWPWTHLCRSSCFPGNL